MMRKRIYSINSILFVNAFAGLSTFLIQFPCSNRCFANASHYPLKQRSLQAKTLELLSKEAVETIGLSWSEDTETKSLQSFRISLFTTDGDLPLEPSIRNVQDAIDRYLFDELNAVYGWANKVKTLRSKVVTQSAAASSRRNMRSLQTTGSTLETIVDIVFKYQPTPTISDVESKVDLIMKKDMSNLLRNLTLVASGDSELENVDSMYYLGSTSTQSSPNMSPNDAPTSVGSGIATTNDAGAIQAPQQTTADKGVNIELLVPLIAGGCLLIAAAALFTNRRRLHSQMSVNNLGPTSTREILHSDAGINLFWDGDSDIFSVEATLVESPNKGSKRQAQNASKHTRDISQEDCAASIDPSDIFSGIDAEGGASVVTSVGESPRSGRNDARSVFSFLSGFASRGEASTVVHSNVTKKANTPTSGDSPDYSPRASEAILGIRANTTSYANAGLIGDEGGTPKSRISSLFTFSEENSDDLYSSSEEKDNSGPKVARKISRPDSNKNDVDNKHYGIADLSPLSTKFPENNSAENANGICSTQTPTNTQSVSVMALSSTPKDGIGLKTVAGGKDTVDELYISSPYSCFSGVPQEVSTPSKTLKNKWDILLSPFHDTVKESEASIASPRSLENMRDNSSLVVDDGYNTDPGPFGRKLKQRKIEATNRNRSSDTHPWRVSLRSWRKSAVLEPDSSLMNTPALADDIQSEHESFSTHDLESFSTNGDGSPTGGRRGRRHTKNPTGDGTNKYQHETMGDWSLPDYTNELDNSVNEPAIPGMDLKRRPNVNVTQIEVNASKKRNRNLGVDTTTPVSPMSPSHHLLSTGRTGTSPSKESMSAGKTPRSPATTVSGLSLCSGSPSESSASKQLISDLVWLEKKINSTTNKVVTSPRKSGPGPSDAYNQSATVEHCDSLSFNSDDGGSSSRSNGSVSVSGSKRSNSKKLPQALLKSPPSNKQDPIHSIICRDCYAPPGKLKIVIHSTKDGPAVHTVKKGSSLEGHIFPGDLIISVDNIDTRSYSAEQVMKMMTAKTRFERKITVLHFEEQDKKII